MNDLSIYNQSILDKHIQDFRQSINVKDITRQYYSAQIKYFFRWVRDNNAIFSENILIYYKNDLQKNTLSPQTINSYLVSIKRFLNYLFKKKVIPFNPSENVKLFATPKGHLREAFSAREVRKILQSINRKTIEGKRNYAIINLLARCGLRTIELTRADIGDIKKRHGKNILVVHGKKRDVKDEIVVLTDEALRPIKIYLKAIGNIRVDIPIFTSISNRNKNKRLSTRSIRKIIHRQIKACGIVDKRLSSHSFRHFCASNSLSNGSDITKVQKMLRHRNINTSMIYVHEMSRLQKSAEEYVKI